MPAMQIISGNHKALKQLADSLSKHGHAYKYVQVKNPATNTVTPAIEFSKEVYRSIIGA
jgi:hypothetical protein